MNNLRNIPRMGNEEEEGEYIPLYHWCGLCAWCCDRCKWEDAQRKKMARESVEGDEELETIEVEDGKTTKEPYGGIGGH